MTNNVLWFMKILININYKYLPTRKFIRDRGEYIRK